MTQIKMEASKRAAGNLVPAYHKAVDHQKAEYLKSEVG